MTMSDQTLAMLLVHFFSSCVWQSCASPAFSVTWLQLKQK